MDHSEFRHLCPVCKKQTSFRLSGPLLCCDGCGKGLSPRALLHLDLWSCRKMARSLVEDREDGLTEEEAALLLDVTLPFSTGHTDTAVSFCEDGLNAAQDGTLCRGLLLLLSGLLVLDRMRIPSIEPGRMEGDLVSLQLDGTCRLQVQRSSLMDTMVSACRDPFLRAMDLLRSGLKCLAFHVGLCRIYGKIALLEVLIRFPLLDCADAYVDMNAELAQVSLFLSQSVNAPVGYRGMRRHAEQVILWNNILDSLEAFTSARIWEVGQRYGERFSPDPALQRIALSDVYSNAALLMPVSDNWPAFLHPMPLSVLQELGESCRKVLEMNDTMERLLDGQPDQDSLIPKEEFAHDRDNWLYLARSISEEGKRRGLA